MEKTFWVTIYVPGLEDIRFAASSSKKKLQKNCHQNKYPRAEKSYLLFLIRFLLSSVDCADRQTNKLTEEEEEEAMLLLLLYSFYVPFEINSFGRANVVVCPRCEQSPSKKSRDVSTKHPWIIG